MTGAEATHAVLTEALRYLRVREVPIGSNRGTQIDYFVSEAGLDPKGGFPWCAAFFGQVGRQALGAKWPCPRTAGVQVLVDWAKRPGAPAGLWASSPEVGDAFVVWHTDLGRYAHIGLVAEIISPATAGTAPSATPGLPSASPARFRTVEGNSNPAGGREGYGVFQLERTASDQVGFIRWVTAYTP